ncbi:MAG: hypothetical protein ACREPW_11355 [Candidatus Binataceae bacterium]
MTAKTRRERTRWHILQMLQAARPVGINESCLRRILTHLDVKYSVAELRSEIDYFRERELIAIDERDADNWGLMLKSAGIMVAEWSVPPPAGINRPSIRQWRRGR